VRIISSVEPSSISDRMVGIAKPTLENQVCKSTSLDTDRISGRYLMETVFSVQCVVSP
jgi:hypothetical protein